MAEIGSFALLLALALSVYSFLAGIVALIFQNRAAAQPAGVAARSAPFVEENSLVAMLRQGSERIGETARRAGIATFAGVLLASVILVICAFQNDFSVSYILHHSNRDLPAAYKFAVLWSGQEGSSALLVAVARRIRIRSSPALQDRSAALRLCLGGVGRRADILSFAAQLGGQSFRDCAGNDSR